MVYISNGQVLDSRNQSPWRLSFITDFFWGIAEFVVFFFKTLLQQDVKKRRGYGGSSDSRYDDGRGPPGNPPRRMGRISHLRGPSPPPMAGGGR
uniref:Selenoprotein K n=1 Tax=Rattus norvegicus TaxID=10116 RepID=A0ABK0L9Y2_RAT